MVRVGELDLARAIPIYLSFSLPSEHQRDFTHESEGRDLLHQYFVCVMLHARRLESTESAVSILAEDART